MKVLITIVFILFNSNILLAANINEQKFSRECLFENQVPELKPIDLELDIKTLMQEIMSLDDLMGDLKNGCENRLNKIKRYLDKLNLPSATIYLAVVPKGYTSKFKFGPLKTKWNYHYANIISYKGELKVIDPIVSTDNFITIKDWFDALAGPGKVVDITTLESIYDNPDSPVKSESSEPGPDDLQVAIFKNFQSA